MKLIDREGRLFGKISIVDVLVVLVVLVLALALHTKSSEKEITSANPDTEIVFQLQAQAVPDYVAEAVLPGDSLYEVDRATGGALGEILSVEKAPGEKMIARADGQIVMAPAEDCVNLLITVRGSGIIGEDGRVLVNRIYELGVNSARSFCTDYAQFVATVTEIEH